MSDDLFAVVIGLLIGLAALLWILVMLKYFGVL